MGGKVPGVNGGERDIAEKTRRGKMRAMTVEQAESQLLTVEDYLAGEEANETKHEYVGGMVYAMAGGVNRHHAIASNVLGLLHGQVRGKPGRPFNSDTKVRVQYPTHTRFYYPDAMVVCGEWPPEQHFQDTPTLLVEVASPSTRARMSWKSGTLTRRSPPCGFTSSWNKTGRRRWCGAGATRASRVRFTKG